MTSRFRSNWAKEGPKSTSPTLDCASSRANSVPIDSSIEYQHDHCRDDSDGKRTNGSRSARDSSVDNRNGKSRERNGTAGSCYGVERELDNESESPDMNYYRRYRPDFRCRGAEVEESPRERRPLAGRKGAISVAQSSTRRDLVEDEAGVGTPERSLPGSAMTNGESLAGVTGNGSAKQVNRSAERRGAASSSLTRERIVDLSSSTHRAVDVTNRSAIFANDKSNGNSRERSARRFSRTDDSEEFRETAAEINDCGSMDRRRSRRTGDRSHSPIDDVTNGNGTSSRRREIGDRGKFWSPARRGDTAEDQGSIDRKSRRHAKERSYSPPEEEGDAGNEDFDDRGTRSARRETSIKTEGFGSTTRQLSGSAFEDRDVFVDNGTSRSVIGTNGGRGENGNGKKYSEIDDDESSRWGKESSRRKSYAHHKASPDDFDVQIHRYERALRVPRRDSDLSRKSSFGDHEYGLSRKSSVDDRHRSRDVQSSKKLSHKHRDTEFAGRGSSEDRDREQVSRKSSFRNRDSSSSRKSSLTNRNMSDNGAINNNNGGYNGLHNNGSHHADNRADRSGSSRRDRDPSITRRRSSRSNVDDDEDHDSSSWKNDRHSRPLTPPTSLEDIETHDDSRDRGSTIGASSSSKRRFANNKDELTQKYVLDRNDYRGKAHEADVGRERDRFSSATRRVVSSRSFNESRKDDSSRISRIDGGNKPLTRDPLVDRKDPRDEGRNSDFSTIERNGTTVIRIRTNSESPVGHVEARSRRRTSHQEFGPARYRKYEDEAEDEDEDDETFDRDNQRRVDSSWRNYKVGQRRHWSHQDEVGMNK